MDALWENWSGCIFVCASQANTLRLHPVEHINKFIRWSPYTGRTLFTVRRVIGIVHVRTNAVTFAAGRHDLIKTSDASISSREARD